LNLFKFSRLNREDVEKQLSTEKWLALVIICLMAVAVTGAYYWMFKPATGKLEFLRTSGRELVAESGSRVYLRGMNVAVYSGMSLDVVKEDDIGQIAGWGANSIRLALTYKLLEDDGAPFVYKQDGFSILDRVLDWCEKYRLYVILDLHAVQGRVAVYEYSRGGIEFWKNTQNQDRFIALWRAIASRYATRAVVAGYDLVNEPIVPDAEAYVSIVTRTIEAIRSVDKRHIIIVETIHGIVGKGALQDFVFVPVNDSNLMYSFHFYYPFQITHYYLPWRGRDIASYPGHRVTGGKLVRADFSIAVNGTNDWRRLAVEASPPKGAEAASVLLYSEKNSGTVWFDDIELREDSRSLDLPATGIKEDSFETWGDLRWVNWTSIPGTIVVRDSKVAHSGTRSLKIAKSIGETTIASRFFAVNSSAHYTLTAWIKTDQATGRNYLALKWYEKKVVEHFNQTHLEAEMEYAINFMNAHNVPIYAGEFGAQQNPNRNNDLNWVQDTVKTFEKYKFHWGYWCYLGGDQKGFPIVYGTRKPGVSDTIQNVEVLEILERYFKLGSFY
jgi:endoglucanase